MAEAEGMRTIALRLMRLALPLLDRSEERIAAARLQHAIDAVGPDPTVVSGGPETAVCGSRGWGLQPIADEGESGVADA